ncbi:MAG: hypothetical protein ACUVX1_12910 [Chloroflexota bacterium]
MTNAQPSRYHAEVQITVAGHQARINVFADTLAEVCKDIGTICAQYPISAAKAEILAAERKLEQLKEDRLLTKTNVPSQVCRNCGSPCQLIQWADRQTGERKEAWKCPECHQWQSNGKKNP